MSGVPDMIMARRSRPKPKAKPVKRSGSKAVSPRLASGRSRCSGWWGIASGAVCELDEPAVFLLSRPHGIPAHERSPEVTPPFSGLLRGAGAVCVDGSGVHVL